MLQQPNLIQKLADVVRLRASCVIELEGGAPLTIRPATQRRHPYPCRRPVARKQHRRLQAVDEELGARAHDVASAAERRKCHPTPRAAPILTPAHRPRRPRWRWLPSCCLASGVGRQGKVRRGSNRTERHGSARLQCRGTCVGLPCQALRPAVSTCLLVATAARSCMSVRCGGRSVGGIRRLFVFVWLCWRTSSSRRKRLQRSDQSRTSVATWPQRAARTRSSGAATAALCCGAWQTPSRSRPRSAALADSA